jgi:hypothetical protein
MKSRLPRRFARGFIGQSMRRSCMPSGAVHSEKTAPSGCTRQADCSFTMGDGYGLESNAV